MFEADKTADKMANNNQMANCGEKSGEKSSEKSSEKSIEKLLGTAMEKLGGMVRINTVVGEAIAAGGVTVVPISRVSLGFVAGGGEYGDNAADPAFGGGSGGGMSVSPMGFLTCCDGQVRYIPVSGQQPLDKLVDMAPLLLERIGGSGSSGSCKTGKTGCGNNID